MTTSVEVLYLAEVLKVCSYGYRPDNKHTAEDNFLRDITPCLVVNSYGRFKGSFCLHVQRRAVKEDREHNALFTFIHSAVCLTTGPKPLPKRALHIVRSRASSFK